MSRALQLTFWLAIQLLTGLACFRIAYYIRKWCKDLNDHVDLLREIATMLYTAFLIIGAAQFVRIPLAFFGAAMPRWMLVVIFLPMLVAIWWISLLIGNRDRRMLAVIRGFQADLAKAASER